MYHTVRFLQPARLGDDRIAQVAVVGVPDERLGEVGVAFVVPRSDFEPTPATPDEIVAWCRDHMANYKVPRRVVLVDALPLNASGKDSAGNNAGIPSEVQGVVDSVDLTASPPLLSIGGQSYTTDQIRRVVRPGSS